MRNALAIQRTMSARDSNLSEERQIRFRVVINVGNVIVEDDDIHGDGVNVAARIEGLCNPGKVFVSATVRDQVDGKIKAAFEDLGEHTVKNIEKLVRVYSVSATPGSKNFGAGRRDEDEIFISPDVAVRKPER